jgi:[ribosomal protein S5]-alanine N-acetyltransferase
MNPETDRLLLKGLTWEDLENIHTLHCYPAVEEFNTIGIPTSVEDTRTIIRAAIEDRQLKTRKQFGWGIFLKTTEDFIGEAGMNLSANRFKMGEIHYSLVPDYWGKGYATEVVKALIRFGFENLSLHRIQAGVATENVKSIKVLEKAGMIREGRRRKVLPIRGEWKDNYHYAIIEDDPREF